MVIDKQAILYHKLANSIIREYDIRGIVDISLNEKDAYFIGYAFAQIVKNNNGKNVAVGFDGRLTSPKLFDSLTEGILDNGVNVVNIGVGPTPMLYYSVYQEKFDAGIMITGSHNPPSHNGFKMMIGKKPFFGEDIKNLAKLISDGLQPSSIRGKVKYNADIKENYTNKLISLFPNIFGSKDLSNFKIAWDPGNGATGEIVEEICKELSTHNIVINSKIDGLFPAHHPDPTIKENLKQIIEIIKNEKCDLGIAFDGDGDRVVFIDSDGEVISGDQMLLIFVNDFLQNPDNKNKTIIADVKSSDVLFNEIERLGGNSLMWKTGHSLIKSKMQEMGVEIAGEMSGHIFFADKYYGFDDGIYAALRMVNILANDRQESLKVRREKIPSLFSTDELRIECSEEEKFSIINNVANLLKQNEKEFSDIDGIRVREDGGWWLIRASNTQACLVVRVEAISKERLSDLAKDLINYLKVFGIESAEFNKYLS